MPSGTPNRLRNSILRITGIVLLFMFAWWTAACALIDTAIFPGHKFPPPTLGPQKVRSVEPTIHWLDLPDDGQRVEAWLYLPPGADAEHPAPVAIFSHGNGEVIDQHLPLVDGYLQRGVGVFLPEWRGYGRSGGVPSQAAIADDMRRFYEWLVQVPGVDRTRLIYHGRSLGGGVTCDLARDHKPAAMVLESCFTSVTALTTRLLIPPLLVKHPFRNDQVIADADYPLLIMHGTLDSAIPVAHARTNRDSATRSPKVLYAEFNCNHNDLPPPGKRSEYWHLVDQLLATIQ